MKLSLSQVQAYGEYMTQRISVVLQRNLGIKDLHIFFVSLTRRPGAAQAYEGTSSG